MKEPPVDLSSLWQSQPVEALRLSPAELRTKAQRLQRLIGRRNLGEYLAALFVVVVFGFHAWNAENLASRVGALLVIGAAVFIVQRLHSRGSARPVPPEELAASCLAFHRRELQRQHALLRSVWKWYLAPFAPGLALLLGEAASRARTPGRLLAIVGFGVGFALMAAAVAKVNQLAARQLQDELRALEAADNPPLAGG
jgi:hypothetical protein